MQDNGGLLTYTQMVLILILAFFFMLNDLSDFVKIDISKMWLKIIGSVFAFLLLCAILRAHQLRVFTGMAEISKEKLLVSSVA